MKAEKMPIQVAIVEDNPDLLLGVELTLKSNPAYKVVGTYDYAEGLIDEFDVVEPDVVLMDIELKGMSGIEATEVIKREHPRVQIVIFSVFEDNENVFQALCAGACGYVAKPVMPDQVIDAVEQAFGGSSPMSPHIARKVVEMFREYAPPPRADYNLTSREFEVLDMLIQGYDNKMIADKLFLSAFTVRAHIRNIYDKLHVHSKSQAVAKALKERITSKK